MTRKVLNPRSSESWIPLFVIDRKIKFGFFLQQMTPLGLLTVHSWHFYLNRSKKGHPPFGLYIRIPFMFWRWGCA